MERKEIFAKLGTTAPSKIEFQLENGTLTVTLTSTATISNMQEDGSAFEGWILLIMYRLRADCGISNVILDWGESTITKGIGHYARFIYRVLKFKDRFSEWFEYNPAKKEEVERFKLKHLRNLVLNYPKSDSKESVDNINEAYLERQFLKLKNMLPGFQFDFQNHQLPVGAFNDVISNGTTVFTGGKSAIDLWSLKEDKLWIFELKYENKKVGIITELLFYLWVMEDVHILKNIKYPVLDNKLLKKSTRDFDKMYDKKINQIYGVLLAEKFHPAINDIEFIDYINGFLGDSLKLLVQKYKIVSSIELIKD